jgi:hypothetical protein
MSMRRQFTTADPSDFDVNDHAAWCGEGPDALHELAVTAFSGAARRGERMVLISEQPDPDRLAALDDFEALLDRGALQLTTVEAAYRSAADIPARLAQFEALLDLALAEGHSGICIVADNSRLVGGSEQDFAVWLGWEATADEFQATRPVNGVCYFDRERVENDRLADIAAMHPVLSLNFGAPSFQLFIDDDAVRVIGDLDTACAEQLRRILASAPKLLERLLDLSGVEFIDHRALLVLNDVASDGQMLRLRGARAIARRVWDILDVPTPALEFC